MKLFIGFHKTDGPIDEKRIPKGWANYKRSAKELGLKTHRVYFNAQLGIGYCITEAQTKEEVVKAHSDIGMDLQELTEVKELK